jgi:hypothetical protein
MATPAYSRETRNLLYLSRPRRQGSPAYETVAFLQVSRADDRLLAHLASLTPSGTLIQETFLLRCVSSMCLESLSCHLESRTVTLECNFGKVPSHQCCVLPRRAYRVKGSILLQDFYVAKHRDFTFTLLSSLPSRCPWERFGKETLAFGEFSRELTSDTGIFQVLEVVVIDWLWSVFI